MSKKPHVITVVVESEQILIIVDTIAKSLRLEGDVGTPVLLDEDQVFVGFKSMRYEGKEFISRREIKKSYLSQEWMSIAHVLICYMDHRKGRTDGLNFDWGRAMLTICRGQKANIPQIIF